MGGRNHLPTALLSGKSRHPTCRRLGGPRVRSGRARKVSPPTGIRSPDRPTRNMSIYLPSQLQFYPITFTFIHLRSHKVYSSFTSHQTDLYCPDGSVKRRRDVTDCGLQVAETQRFMPAVYKRDVKAVSTTCDLNTSDPGLRQCTVTLSSHVNQPH